MRIGVDMNVVEKYAVVYGDDPNDLRDTVQRKIEGGWQPYGSPYYVRGTISDYAKHCQAVVKYAKGS